MSEWEMVKDKVALKKELFIEGSVRGTTLQVDGDLATEAIVISLIGLDGTTMTPAVEGGTAVVLDADNTHKTFYGNMAVEVSKPITTNNVGVKLV